MSRSKVETILIALATALLLVAVAYLAFRMQLFRPVDYQEDIRFKNQPTANPPL